MSLATQMRRAAAGVSAGEYDPLSIGWTHGVWAEDPDWTNPGNGNTITSWRNFGTPANPFDQTYSSKPTFSTTGLGGQPTSVAAGAASLLPTSFASSAQPNTFVLVAEANSSSADFVDGGGVRRHLVDLSSGKMRMFSGLVLSDTTDLTLNTPHMVVAEFNTSSSRLLIDGSVVASGDAGSQEITQPALFLSGGTAKIAFFGFYDGVLGSSDQADLLAWAQDKYGVA